MKKRSCDDFINEANNRHNCRYDYSKFIYISRHTKGIIICHKHGEFTKTPGHHLDGQGCPKCIGHFRKNLKFFISEAINIHGNDRYDYSLIIKYINARTKVPIKCNICSIVFSQRIDHHLRGVGCPNCKRGNISKKEIAWLDYMHVPQNINNRQIFIKAGNHKYKVDGYIAETNTVYEFNGDYWHGNPEIHDANDIHPIINKSFGELYQYAICKLNDIVKAGYNLVFIWEKDWDNMRKNSQI